MNEVRENLRFLLDKNGLTMKEVSLRAKLNAAAVRDIIVGRVRNPTLDSLERIAAVIGCTVADLQGRGQSIPLLGTITASDRINLNDSGETVPPCPGVTGDVAALRAEDRINGILRKGDLVYYRQEGQPMIGHLSVVQLKDGRTFLKEPRRGYEPGRWNLQGVSDPGVMENQEVEWAGVVVAMVPMPPLETQAS